MENEIRQTLHWIFFAAAIWVLIINMIPFRFIKTLWLPALITGFAMTYLINSLASYLKMWSFSPTALALFHTPLFLALTWYGAILVFDYLVLVYRRFKILLIILFALITIIFFRDASREGHIKMENWSLAETFFMAIIAHGVSLMVLKLFTKIQHNK
jgi:phosphoglycerol transferase MdoB-like AlkP superfamily enzyme